MELEKLATSAVISELGKTDLLSSFINSGDKEPCWDGNIYIHEDISKTKKNIKKVATQIKGKAVSPKQVKRTITYSIERDDLHAYMMNGGSMFFVVYLDKDNGDVLQIYYTDLPPVKIKDLFKNHKKKYSVKFRKFPPDKIRKTELFLNFYEDALKQASFAGKDLPSVNDLKKQGILESLTFGYTSLQQNNDDYTFPKIIDGNPLTIYANIKGSTAPIPVEYYECVTNLVMHCQNTIPITVNERCYYSSFQTVTTAEYVEQRIGSSVKLITPNIVDKNVPVPLSLEVKLSGRLKEQIASMEFITAMMEHGSFCIGDIEIPVNFPIDDLNRLKKLVDPDILKQYRLIQALLESMNVNKDLDIGKCTKDDINKINLLMATIRDKRPVRGEPESWNKIQQITIANLTIAVAYIKRPSGGYYICDYFGNHLDAHCQLDNSALIRVSQFVLLTPDDYLVYDNLNLTTVVDDFRRIDATEHHINDCNNTVLAILKAYDKQPSTELLEAALQLSTYIDNYPEYIHNSIRILNRLQIILRQRSLTFKEKSDLYPIAAYSDEEFYRLGAFLLLGEQEEAKAIFDNMNAEDRETFKDFPLYKFYKFPEEDVENGQT